MRLRDSGAPVLLKGHQAALAAGGLGAVAIVVASKSFWSDRLARATHVERFDGMSLLVCALLASFVCHLVAREPAPAIALTSPRGYVALRLMRMLLVSMVAAATLRLAGGSAGSYVAAVTLCLLGELLAADRYVGPDWAWAVPVGHVTASVMFGRGLSAEPHAWAWILYSPTGNGTPTLDLLVWAMAVVIWALAPR